MAKVKVTVRLLKPLNGAQIGSEAEYDERDAARLVARGAVELLDAEADSKPKAKAKAKAPKNKMKGAPANKAAAASSPPSGGEGSASGPTEG